MDARSFTLGGLFNEGGGIQYMVPYFQRQYTWTKKDWQVLLEDVLLLCNEKNDDDAMEHFMGSVVIVSSGCAGSAPRYTLIDGQQRLITISLLLKSLSAVGGEALGETQGHITAMLTNALEKGTNALKVLPSEKKQDRSVYRDLVGTGATAGTESSTREAYNFFVERLQTMKADEHADLQHMYDMIIKHLRFIRIETVSAEKPYRIFESLNGKGEALKQGDLIRNYVAMRLPDPDDQDDVFRGSWGTIDTLLDDAREVGKSRMGELTAFIRHYLAALSGVLYDERSIYQELRNLAEVQASDVNGFKALINRLARYATYYDRLLRPSHEKQTETSSRLSSLALFDQSASYPLLLEAYEALEQGSISRDQFNDMLLQLEGYFVRRFLCGYPTNYTTKQLPQVWREVAGRSDLVEALRVSLGKRESPTDREIAEDVVRVKLYRSTQATPRIAHILLKASYAVDPDIDAHPVVSPTLEHIMPQTLSAEWRALLGPEADDINSKYGDTLANLTLIPPIWNIKLSNNPFDEKRLKLLDSKLPLNYKYFAKASDSWGVDQIEERGQWLAGVLNSIYPEFPRTTVPTVRTEGRSPRMLRLDGKLLHVGSWRDVTLQTMLYVVEHGMFEKVRLAIPLSFQREEDQPSWRPRWRKLPNGWRVNTNLSAKGTVAFCGRVLSTAGFPSLEWGPLFDDVEAM